MNYTKFNQSLLRLIAKTQLRSLLAKRTHPDVSVHFACAQRWSAPTANACGARGLIIQNHMRCAPFVLLGKFEVECFTVCVRASVCCG